MKTTKTQLLIEIAEKFATGDLAFATPYLAEDIKWNILGENTITGKEQVLEVSKMSQLQSFPAISIKNVIAEENFVVIESSGKAMTKSGMPYVQYYCDIFKFEAEMLQEITTYLDTALSASADS